jgi:hypothetical protein
MIPYDLIALGFMCFLLGVVVGTKTSTHRWIEYHEHKNRKAKNDVA